MHQALEGARDDGELRVGLVTWRRHRFSELVLREAPAGCFAVRGFGSAPRPELIGEVIDQLSKARVHIALFPELALEAHELEALRTLLRARSRRFPVLVAAGLTHQPASTGASHINEAVLLDAKGDELLRHEKLEPFTAPDGTLEDILPRQSEGYALLDTPVGRVVLNICRDFRSDVPMFLNRVLGASLILVPTYSNKLDFVLEEARVLGARQLACTFAVNPLCDEGLRDATAVYAPIRGEAGQVLTPQTDLRANRGDVVIRLCRLELGHGREAKLETSTLAAV